MSTASSTPSIAASAACTFVAFESSMNRTPSTIAATWPRCGGRSNDASPTRTADAAAPKVSDAAAAAAASARTPGVPADVAERLRSAS